MVFAPRNKTKGFIVSKVFGANLPSRNVEGEMHVHRVVQKPSNCAMRIQRAQTIEDPNPVNDFSRTLTDGGGVCKACGLTVDAVPKASPLPLTTSFITDGFVHVKVQRSD